MLTLRVFSCCLSLDTGDTGNTGETALDTEDAIDTGDIGHGGAELVEICLKAELIPATLTKVSTICHFFKVAHAHMEFWQGRELFSSLFPAPFSHVPHIRCLHFRI